MPKLLSAVIKQIVCLPLYRLQISNIQVGLHTQTSTYATSWWWSKGSSKDLFCIFMFLSTLEELEQGLQPQERSAHPSILIIRSLSSGGRRAREWRRRWKASAQNGAAWARLICVHSTAAAAAAPRNQLHMTSLGFPKKIEIFSLILLALFAWVIGLSTLYQAACLPFLPCCCCCCCCVVISCTWLLLLSMPKLASVIFTSSIGVRSHFGDKFLLTRGGWTTTRFS